MSQVTWIDTGFDIKSDAGGKDPDRYSPTLRRYHELLWSKPLPDGRPFELEDVFPRGYLRHTSDAGEFPLSSDMIIRTFRRVIRMKPILDQIPDSDKDDFTRRGRTIGGTIIFPSSRVNGADTINQARGKSRRIEDRFDLTLECIRRHYVGEPSPLADVMCRYKTFFELFKNFRGYVDFFLLQDLVRDDYAAVSLFSPWTDFSTPALPSSVEEYKSYRKRTIDFVEARNARIRNARPAETPVG